MNNNRKEAILEKLARTAEIKAIMKELGPKVHKALFRTAKAEPGSVPLGDVGLHIRKHLNKLPLAARQDKQLYQHLTGKATSRSMSVLNKSLSPGWKLTAVRRPASQADGLVGMKVTGPKGKTYTEWDSISPDKINKLTGSNLSFNLFSDMKQGLQGMTRRAFQR